MDINLTIKDADLVDLGLVSDFADRYRHTQDIAPCFFAENNGDFDDILHVDFSPA